MDRRRRGGADRGTRPPARDLSPALLAGIVAVGAALRFSTLSLQSFWLDEAVTAQLVRRGFGGMLSAIPSSESTPPLYYALLWPWSRLFGQWEAGLRSLSALAGTALVAVAYAIGRDLASRRAGLVAAALAAVNPLLVWYSQEARAYMLLALLAALSFLFFERALRGGRRALAAWAIASAAALATHYFAIFMVAPEAAWLLVRMRAGRSALAAVGGVAAVGAALLPLVVEQASADRAQFIRDVSRARRIAQVPKQYLVGYDSAAETALTAIAVLLAALGLLLLARRAGRSERRSLRPAAGVAAFAIAVPVLMALAGGDYLLTRNLIAALPVCLVVLAAGFAAAPPGIAAALALCALSAVAVISVDATPAYQRDDWRSAARAVGAPGPGRAIAVAPTAGAIPLELYVHARPYPPTGVVREVVSLAVATRGPSSEGREKPREVPQPRPPGYRVAELRRTAGYDLVRLRPGGPVRLGPADVLFLRIAPTQAALLQPPR
ncbi:MAG: glycosyltransferase family 39 protein [Thermoleophilaceae bacterium]|nr:glycosyltransferase family 39 protein [Thermoleophilaceae bacterium]